MVGGISFSSLIVYCSKACSLASASSTSEIDCVSCLKQYRYQYVKSNKVDIGYMDSSHLHPIDQLRSDSSLEKAVDSAGIGIVRRFCHPPILQV